MRERLWPYIVASYEHHEPFPMPQQLHEWMRWNLEMRRWPAPPRYFLRFCVLSMWAGFLVSRPDELLGAARWRLAFWKPTPYRPETRWTLRYVIIGRSV